MSGLSPVAAERKVMIAIVGCLVFVAIVRHYWNRIVQGDVRRPLVLIHDGGVDDMTAMMVLFGAKRSYQLAAVLVQSADSFQDTAVFSTLYVLNTLEAKGVTVAAGHDEGTNPFPNKWREQSDAVAAVLQQLDLPQHGDHIKLGRESPYEVLARLLREGPHTIVVTAPVTFLAQALRVDPSLAKNIEQVYIMGGALEVEGNVKKSPYAEWNFYNSPEDAQTVIHSAISQRTTLIGLDVTRFLPVNQPLTKNNKYLDELLLAQSKKGFVASTIAYHLWNIVLKDQQSFGLYHLWDTLAAVVAIKSDIVTTKQVKVRVISTKPDEGRMILTDEPDGSGINVGVRLNKPHFAKVFLNALRY